MMRVLMLLLSVALLAGCARFGRLQDDIDAYQASVARMSGTLASACADCPVIVVPLDAQGQPLGYKVFEGPGRFEMMVDKSTRSVFAFHDTDGDLRYDAGEAFAWQPIAGGDMDAVNLNLRAASAQPAPGVLPQGSLFALRNRGPGGVEMQVGTPAQLADARFDREKAKLGMWQPVGFMREGLAGVYFLQPYSAGKTPVLLVHGIGGTPRDFEPLLAHIDRTRFQPWVFYYPSGLELSAVGTGLMRLLNELQRQYGFRELHVVAHSMGGLVARSYLNECRQLEECSYLRTFTSISSPFGGASAAQVGVEIAPAVMPVWRDMSPQSRFLGELFASPPPVQVQHHMVFGYSDKTVPLRSQLPLAAQQQAASVRGFDEDHMAILASPAVAAHLNAVLAGQVGPH
ncbi:alpha/beta hydrolase [Ramlibacter sp. G-1-2-2]|uniref:Alpha/beta hydrolase n=1 Tax=Ramlibacter agri TaxID=2728837 RepID=A0A848GXV4_9BURK|nr:alpha/beta hydrolase [Ramlibacter agri]NML43184.1 alpha/beta hydrolase [Ramlibacter agri]